MNLNNKAKHYFTYLAFLLLCLNIGNAQVPTLKNHSTQNTNLTSSNNSLSLRANWTDDSLPTISGIGYNDIWGYTDCNGNEYAILGSPAYTLFFNVTNPDNIIEVNRFQGTGVSIWRDYKTYGQYAYGVADQGSEGLAIYDLSNLPNTVNYLGEDNSVFSTAHNIYIDEENGRMYVAGSNTQNGGIIVYDLTNDPANPQVIGNVSLQGGYIHDVFVRDNIAYCSHGFNGYFIYDFSNASNPITLASSGTNGYNHSSWVTEDGNYAMIAEEVPAGLPMLSIDISNMQNGDINVVKDFKEPLLAPTHTNNTPHNPFIRGDHLIISYYEDGVVVFDISNPADPQRIAYYDTAPTNTTYNGTGNCWGTYPFLPSGNILGSDTNNGLFVLTPSGWNLSPTSPVSSPCGNNSASKIQAKVFLEGFFNGTNALTKNANYAALIPNNQPFNTAPWNYNGNDSTNVIPTNAVDWILLATRDANGTILEQKAGFITTSGEVLDVDGTMGISINNTATYFSIHHKSHLAVMSSSAYGSGVYDFTNDVNQAMGTAQMVQQNGKYMMYSGDFDGNGIINNIDYNNWKTNAATLNQYLNVDGDGNGNINNLDYNLWTRNRSKIAHPPLKY